MDHAFLVGGRALDGQLEGIKGVSGIPPGHTHQMLERLILHLDGSIAVAVLLILEGAFQNPHHVFIDQRLKLEDTGPRDEGADDLEVGVLCGGANEHDGSILHVGQQGILLCFVPAMDLVDEEDRTLTVHSQAILGFLDDASQVSHPRQHGADGLEVPLRRVSDDHRQRRFARARRPPEDQRGEESIRLDGAAQ